MQIGTTSDTSSNRITADFSSTQTPSRNSHLLFTSISPSRKSVTMPSFSRISSPWSPISQVYMTLCRARLQEVKSQWGIQNLHQKPYSTSLCRNPGEKRVWPGYQHNDACWGFAKNRKVSKKELNKLKDFHEIHRGHSPCQRCSPDFLNFQHVSQRILTFSWAHLQVHGLCHVPLHHPRRKSQWSLRF